MVCLLRLGRRSADGRQTVGQAARLRLRLRPLMMTSLCFALGVLPLTISSDAGDGGQNALGTTVVFGVLAATLLGIYYTPIFFVLVTRLFTARAPMKDL